MPDRENVINGLECCLDRLIKEERGIEERGVVMSTRQDSNKNIDAIRDAIALLKAQEPRVMDFDDVVGGDECWLEAVNGACGYADCYACTGTGEVQVFRCNFDNPQYIMASDYLKTWRCWTSRPTDEQREREPWNG